MHNSASLAQLCAVYGIAPHYHDIWGNRVAIPDANLVALLAEFNVEASTPERVGSALQEAQAAAWRQSLPAVAAISAGAPRWSLAVRLPESATALRWTVTEEGGAQHHGEIDAARLPVTQRAQCDGQPVRELQVELALALPAGYHTLAVDGVEQTTLLIAAPARCYQPPALAENRRIWGPSVQLYGLRSERNWGIGDFGDLFRFVETAADIGAGIVGLNPLHALFAHNPAHASPYSPSSRIRLNVLYLDVEAIEEFRECEPAQRVVRSAAFQTRLARLRDVPLVDYPGVCAAKTEILELLYAHFREHHLGKQTPRGRTFREFQENRGSALRLHAVYEALQAQFHGADAAIWGWPVWPDAYRDHDSPEVAQFSEANRERIEFYEYLQWQADNQLERVNQRCQARGLAVGLYLDLAVSVDRAGSDTWTSQETFALGASVGAPPDEFNPNGQGWGLPPLRPDRLRATGYRVFIEALRENMRHAGALRIDHVMGLMRLYWISPGKTARDGAYVHYALEEMLAIVALESERCRCLVIGEDLGTVADEMRAGLVRYGVLSYRLLYFERGDGGAFKPAEQYPRDALVAVSTHDLATLAGWWSGRDLQVRLELGLFPNRGVYEKQLVDRAQERVRLLLALQHAGILPPDVVVEPTGSQALTPALLEAIHAFVATTPAQVMMVQIEDALGVTDQANMPGTTDEHPNWKRKLVATLEQIATSDRVRRLAAVLTDIRPHVALRAPLAEARVPRATYRLQLNKDFTFADAGKILPYLARLGISHVYCSPILRARPGSLHGYDIVAHDEINPEMGGAEGFARFSAELREHGLGLLLDMVPNHMGVLGEDNAWWMDVLENGPASAYARHFDIDWHPINAELEGKVLVPALGDHYGNLLASGELKLVFEHDAGSFAVRYHEHRFPLDPSSYPEVLGYAEALLTAGEQRAALSSLAAAFKHLPPRHTRDAQALAERIRDKEVHKGRLARLAGRRPDVGGAIDTALATLNAPGPREALHELLEAQAYRLAFWRVASDEINYRRFFDINDLAALRMEDERVFEATHAFTLELAASGAVDGLRIDHPDGLYDPAQYFRRLQEGYARRTGIALPEHDATGRPARSLYVVAEKIAAPHEDVPQTWHVHGTTGYRFANVMTGVLIDTTAQAKFDRIWHSFSREEETFEEFAYLGKRAIMRSALASELTVLSSQMLRIARSDHRTRDYTFNTLRQAIAEVTACLPVYRTYIVDSPTEQDLRYIDWAVAHARRRSQAADTSIFSFVRQSLLGEAIEGASDELRERVRHIAIRFQQFTAPVAAKGVEDTAFYRYHRLTSLNEVGGDPGQFGMTVRAFHGASADRAAHWPHTMLATSTHDNKRSEDVRNRINVLSESPAVWRLALRRWSLLNRGHRTQIDEVKTPSRADEYLFYQTLIGTLPFGKLDESSLTAWRERIEAYMIKAAREAKSHTSWISPNEEYEGALTGFVRGALAHVQPNPFLDDLRARAEPIAWFGALNSLTMALVKYTSPGVPDLYQGNEIMEFGLVDPDNRRPVDYALRARLLDENLAAGADCAAQARAFAQAPQDGRAKLHITARLLSLRRELPDLFRLGSYSALASEGAQAVHVLAYARQHEGRSLVALGGRLFSQLLGEAGRLPLGQDVWTDTTVSIKDLGVGSRFINLLTGENIEARDGVLELAQVFANFPAAVLRPAD